MTKRKFNQMSIRKHSDNVKPGRGISGAKGESWSRDYNQSPWDVVPAGGNGRSYSRNEGSNRGDKWIERGPQNLLRNKAEFSDSAATRSVWDDTCGDEGNGDVNAGFSGPDPLWRQQEPELMLSRKHKQEVAAPMAPPPSLADRIAELRQEIDAFVEARVDDVRAPGVPREVIRQMVVGGTGCHCAAALKVIAEKQRDEEIAAELS
jgi:hypothetical protein